MSEHEHKQSRLCVCVIAVLTLCNYLRIRGCHIPNNKQHLRLSGGEVCRGPPAVGLTTHDTQPVPLRLHLPPETWRRARTENNRAEGR